MQYRKGESSTLLLVYISELNKSANVRAWAFMVSNTGFYGKQCPYSMEPVSCYHRENSSANSLDRGCLDDLPQSEIDECRKDVECKTCSNDSYCNGYTSIQRCYSCDSKLDENCVKVNNFTKTKVCDSYFDTCYALTYAHNK